MDNGKSLPLWKELPSIAYWLLPAAVALDQVGFEFIVEAGLGRGHRDFRAVRLHTLPASRPATQIWRAESAGEQVDDRPAHTRMLKTGELDRCGVTLLAGKAVGAPSGRWRRRWR